MCSPRWRCCSRAAASSSSAWASSCGGTAARSSGRATFPCVRTRSMDRTDRDRLLDHEYDGIEEYDNPLPGWWVWLFWATIVFSGVYVAFYHMGPGPSVIGQYEEDVRLAAERAAKQTATAGAISED